MIGIRISETQSGECSGAQKIAVLLAQIDQVSIIVYVIQISSLNLKEKVTGRGLEVKWGGSYIITKKKNTNSAIR